MCNVLDRIENQGIEKGIAKGKSEGEDKMALLVKKLLEQDRLDDVRQASEDKAYREQLMHEFSIE